MFKTLQKRTYHFSSKSKKNQQKGREKWKYLFMDVPAKEERGPGTQGEASQELHAANTQFLTLTQYDLNMLFISTGFRINQYCEDVKNRNQPV